MQEESYQPKVGRHEHDLRIDLVLQLVIAPHRRPSPNFEPARSQPPSSESIGS